MILHFIFKQERAKTNQDCVNAGTRASGKLVCPNVPGKGGVKGRTGQNGGYAGKPGMVTAPPPLGEGVLEIFLYREAPTGGPTPYPFIYHFDRKSTPFVYILFKKITPSIHLHDITYT